MKKLPDLPKNFPDLPPVWTISAIGLIYLLNWAVPYFLFDFPNAWVGYGFIAIGICLILWSVLCFLRKKTTIEPHYSATTLVIEGPYKISRNPMYLGLVIICFGCVFNVGNPLGFLPLIGLIWILHTRFVIPEEKGLLKTFGKEAETYIEATRRW